VLAFTTQGNYDLRSYELVAGIVQRGGNVYAETSRYNYTPIWSYILYGLAALGPVHVTARVFLSVVDIGNAALIGRIWGYKAGVCYALNPAAILIVGYGGQFETLACLPLLVALISGPVWLLGLAAVLIKHITAPLAWALLVYRYGWRKALVGAAGIGLIFTLTFIPFWTPAIISNVFLYQSITGVYGFAALLPPPIPALLFGAAMLALPLICQRRGLALREAVGIQAVGMIVYLYGMGDQYFILPLLFAGVGLWVGIYSAVVTGVLLVDPWNITAELIRVPYEPRLLNFVWLTACGWMKQYANS
jgi:hypothetical protein